jgi:hypothetical protein
MAGRRGGRVAARSSTKNLPLAEGGPIHKERTLLEREAIRLRRRALRLRGYGMPSSFGTDRDPVSEIYAAVSAIGRAISSLDKIPKSWRPIPGTLGTAALAVGSWVTLRSNYTKAYAGLIEPNKPLRITKMAAGRVVVQIDPSMQMPIPRAHLQLYEDAKEGEL